MPRTFLGTISQAFVLFALPVCMASGEVITYHFAGVIDDIGAAPPSAYQPWLGVGAPVTGFVRWETDLEDTDPDPAVGAFVSLDGGLHLQIGHDPSAGHVASTQSVHLGLNRDLGPEFPADMFTLEGRSPYGASGASGINSLVFHFEPSVAGDSIPTTLLPEGNKGFVIDLTHYGMDHVPFRVRGSITSLSPIGGPHVWTEPADGNWSDPQNWQDGSSPNYAGATAVFGGEGFGESVATVDGPVALTDVMFDSPSRRYVLSGDAPLTLLGPSKIDVSSGEHEIAAPIVGEGWITKTGAGSLTLSGGGNIKGYFNLQNGQLSIEGGPLTTNRLHSTDGDLSIGPVASLIVLNEARLATKVGSETEVNIIVGEWGHNQRDSGRRYIGDRGKATLRIEDGGTMKSNDSYLGYEATGIGEVLISGEGSSWELGYNNSRRGQLTIGHRGAGSLTLEKGARIWNGTTILASETGSQGEVLIRGAGTEWIVERDLIIGRSGAGVFVVDGGVVDSNSVFIGYAPSGDGKVTLSSGAQMSASEFSVGFSGRGSLRIEGGSRLESGVGNRFQWVGQTPGAHGEVVITGEGSKWSAAGYVLVGASGSGSVRVEEGAMWDTTASGYASFGASPAGTAEVEVTGDGSTWMSAGYLTFGGTSRLAIQAGGQVVHKSYRRGPYGDFESMYVPFGGVHSEVLISGLGSRWLIEGRPDFGGNDTSVVVEQEGLLETWEGSLQTGGTVTIVGSGSEWDVRDDIRVAGGRLAIDEGGTLRSSLGSVGRDRYLTKPEWAGAVTISGAGSHWINLDTITVGTPLASDAQVDSLTLSDGGVLSTARLEIEPTGLLTGGGGTIIGDVTNSGTIAPGNTPGVLTIDGNLTQYSDGHLAFEIAGPQAYDQLIVTGHATLAGTLSVELLDGYVPALGTTFQLFNCGSADGELVLEFPRLGGGLGWDTQHLLSSGVITVAPMSAIPEPKSLAAIAMAALLFGATVHRKFAITWDR